MRTVSWLPNAMNRKCIYHDDWDGIITQFILHREPFRGYWNLSEEHALESAEALVAHSPRRRLLDLGCGRGRLLQRFARICDDVVALDSEPARIDQARRLAKATKLSNVRFVNASFESCASELGSFDIVLCSHVIQHVDSETVDAIFKAIGQIIVPGGMLLLMTSHATGKDDAYKVWRLDESRQDVVEDAVDIHTFGRYVGADSSEARLPIRYIADKNLRALFDGYTLVKVHYFHAIHRQNLLDSIVCRDRWMNVPFLKGSFGRDVLVVAKKLG